MLNYKYRLYPDSKQSSALMASMKLIRWGWNLAIRRQKWAERMRRSGREANLHLHLAELATGRQPVGMRASKLNKLIEDGKTREQALAEINTSDVQRVWKLRRSGLTVAYARETVKEAKQAMLGKRMGTAWAKLIEDKGIFVAAWKACWQGIRGAPRKNKDYTRGSLNAQVQGNPTLIVPGRTNSHGDRYVSLSLFMPGLEGQSREVRFAQHRPLPEDAQIKELKVTRHRNSWWVVFTIESDLPKAFPATGRSCGIDPGQKTPCTVVGEHQLAGIEGDEYSPGRPLTKGLKKLRKLQRKLDRQRRANNPQCFDKDGTWLKGRRIECISNGMKETEERIASIHAHCANIRKDYWNKAANEILEKYDTVYLGNWKDGTPAQKGKSRDARKKDFAESGKKRAKGQAAQQTTRERVNRDNALGVFRNALEEKARRSTNPKTVEVVSERNTTRSCCRCGALSGPTGQRGLATRVWTCSECKCEQKRDCGAAWNILQAGRQQAGGQPVKERRKPLVAGGGQGGRRSVPGIEQTSASGEVVSSSRGALARRQPTVPKGGSNINNRGPRSSRRAGPPPLAKGTVSPSNDST
jgi:transposase